MDKTRLALWVGAAAILSGCASSGPQTTVMSGPPVAPVQSGCDVAALQQSMVQQLNAARAAGQMCGQATLAPVKPVRWNPQLATAASRHAADMAKRDFLGERGSDGSQVAQRVSRTGYPARAVGESLAAGDYTPDSVVTTWLGSERHCRTLMNPAFTEVGASCVSDASSDWGTYWTMVLGQRADKKPAPRATRATGPRAKARNGVKTRSAAKARAPVKARASAKARPAPPSPRARTATPVR